MMITASIALMLASASSATIDRIERSVIVSTARLDMARAADRKRLSHRISSAVERVCSTGGGRRMPTTDERTCRQAARKMAMAQLERTRVAARAPTPEAAVPVR